MARRLAAPVPYWRWIRLPADHAFDVLASRPDIQTRLAQEASEILGERLFPPSYEMVEGLQFGEVVLRESMRLKKSTRARSNSVALDIAR
jgi:hypothetical protein